MKPNTAHVIKSVRIGKARMLKPLIQTDLRMVCPRRPKVKRATRAYKTRRGRRGNKNEWSHSTVDSDRGRSRPRRKRAQPESRVESSDVDQPLSGLPNPISLNDELLPSLTRTNLKRIRLQKFPVFLEDGQPWTNHEMKQFEVLYGDKLFDNTIDTGPQFQANLELLSGKKFNSYRKQAAGAQGALAGASMKAAFERARRVLEEHGHFTVSNSQLVRLMSFFPNEKEFWEFLQLEGEVVVNYFGKTKLYPRRKVYK